MSLFDDHSDVRSDDELLAGRAVPGQEALGAVLGRLHALADEAAPAPTAALAAVLRDGLPADEPRTSDGPAITRIRVLRVARWGAGLGLAGKILIGAGVAAAAVAGTATLPLVPDAVQVPVRDALTELGHALSGSGDPVPVPPTDPARVGGGPATDRPSAPGSSDRDGDPGAGAPAGRGDGASPSAVPSVPSAAASGAPGRGEGRGGPPTDVPGGRPSSVPTGSSADHTGSGASHGGGAESPAPTPGATRGGGHGG